MSAFNKLMEEFSAATGVDTVVDGERSCTLEVDGILVTLQYLEDADEVVLFAPVWQPEAEGALPSSATMRAALELGYDGKETGGAHIGLFENSLVLSIHLPMAEAVERADFSKIAKLNSFSDSGAILKAIDQLRNTANPIADVSKYKGGVIDTVDYNAYRKIVEAMAVLKAGPAAQARIRNAMHSMACRHAAVILDRLREEADADNLYPDRNVREIRAWLFDEERRALDEVWEIFQPHDRAPDPIDTDDIDYRDSFNSTEVDFDAMFQAHIDAKLKEAGLL